MSCSSAGHSRLRPRSVGVKTSRGSRRPRIQADKDDIVFIDADNVVVLDVPDSLKSKHHKSRVARKDKKSVILLDVDSYDDEDCERNLNDGASTSKRPDTGSGNAGSSSNGKADTDDIEFVGDYRSTRRQSTSTDGIEFVGDYRSTQRRSTSTDGIEFVGDYRSTRRRSTFTDGIEFVGDYRSTRRRSTFTDGVEFVGDYRSTRRRSTFTDGVEFVGDYRSTRRRSTSNGEADPEYGQFINNELKSSGSTSNERDADGIELLGVYTIPGSTSERDANGVKRVHKHTPPVKLSKGKRTYSGKSKPDIDCELVEDCFIIREQWEKASSKRKVDTRNGQSDAEHPQVIPNEDRQEANAVKEPYKQEKDRDLESDNEKEVDPDCKILKENVIPVAEILKFHGETDHAGWKASSSKEPPCDNGDDFSRRLFEKDRSSSFTEDDKENNPPNVNEETPEYVSSIVMKSDEVVPLHDKEASEGCMKGEREKYKETVEYKKALAEELAVREEALRSQAEAAQKLRRLRKKERAESMRLLDMERRQKRRIEEIRETQKKDEEDMYLKEAIRASVREDLQKLERSCYSMSSLLQGLGIITFGTLPSPSEVRLGYKKALLAFHPDRASRSDMRQQVEAEEKFKLISRMKERFPLPL